MSDNAHAHDEHAAHEGPVKTPKQLVLAVIFAFLVPIVGIILLVNFVASGTKSGAGSDGLTEEAVAARIRPVGTVELRDPSAPRVLKTGQEVYQAQCVACHGAGLAGAPKFGDAAAWAPRVAQGYETLLNSALKGKGAMGAQGGGEFSDLEIGRAVVYMVNNSGGNLPEPAAPAAAAAASQ
ncbi:c-type cytochrome [Caldimonas taiwanensis]|uniref:c-type cytochrome n=1 Tax=Caldimonas taiwanensis TaxID=307483 RepID=UPI000782F5D4|nr:c-type cytochrome [Caldimonas taiwanensis]